ncbi:hypothetical protein HanPI659440_Chr12g0449381 [Helianthus annuus]|nr:hypothetical protein HanPI659440_Chr12g0449381 [Helianthus annuus]
MLRGDQERQATRDGTSAPSEALAAVNPNPHPRSDVPTQSNNLRRSDGPNRYPNRRGPRHDSHQPSEQQQSRGPGSGPRNPSNRNHNRGQPNWNPTQYPPYWPNNFWTTTPPPCPYPTQPGWASPWTMPQPPSQQTNTTDQSSAQAHVTDVNPLEPTELAEAFQAMAIEPEPSQWFMDTGATNHLVADSGMISYPCQNSIKNVLVGNGHLLPVAGSGNSDLPSNSKPLQLKHILHIPNIIKNLISVRKFTRDNWGSVDFDPFGFSVKDYLSGKILSRHDSTSNLYPLTALQPPATSVFVSTSLQGSWHHRLGHPGVHVLDYLNSNKFISSDKQPRTFFV